MWLMKQFYLAALISFTLFGCNKIIKEDAGTAFFGGEIINPKGDKVILYNRNHKISDTLYLDTSNRFSHTLNNLTPGVYSFWHGSEIQFVVIEPNDSIMIRLNTYDFDESLVFTGEGARKNNYLIETFLHNEKEARRLVRYCQKEPEEFETFIVEKHNKELKKLDDFVTKKPISSFSSTIIKACIDYHHYAAKEIYPFAYFGENRLVHYKDLPESFYDFRKNVDYNLTDLSEIFAYNRYLFSHFDNLALSNYYKNSALHSKFNRHELNYNKAKLNLVDSLIEDETIKNSLLKYKTREFISHSNSQKEIEEIMASYLLKTTSEEDIKYMNKLIASIGDLMPGKGLPDLKVINLDDKEFTIADIVTKPTLIYFWSSNYKQHYKNSHYRVRELKEKFPGMAFVSININDNPEKYWKETLYKYRFNLDNEYRFKNPKEALETLAVNYVYKVFIVDENANIIHPNVNIFSDDFEDFLKQLILKKEIVLR